MRSLATVLIVAAALAGCATVQQPDPLERINRQTFAFNEGVDKVVLKPVATAYVKVLPAPVRTGVGNVFTNAGGPWTAANLLLQGEPLQGATQLARFGANTVFGVLGLFDVASRMGLERRNADFGQTLGRWGVGSGAYLVLPLFGPSTVRDATGLPLDLWATPLQTVTPVAVRNSLTVLGFVDARAEALPVTKMIDDIALDKYLFVRDAYLQRRLSRLEVEPEPQMAEARPQLGPGPATSPPQNLAPMRSP